MLKNNRLWCDIIYAGDRFTFTWWCPLAAPQVKCPQWCLRSCTVPASVKPWTSTSLWSLTTGADLAWTAECWNCTNYYSRQSTLTGNLPLDTKPCLGGQQKAHEDLEKVVQPGLLTPYSIHTQKLSKLLRSAHFSLLKTCQDCRTERKLTS